MSSPIIRSVTVFDTTGLKTGMYKVEVPTNGAGDSVNMRVVYLV